MYGLKRFFSEPINSVAVVWIAVLIIVVSVVNIF